MLKQFKRMSIIYICAPILGLLMLCLVYAIPVQPMYDNAKASESFIINMPGGMCAELPDSNYDRWTSSLMILEAIDDSRGSLIERALKCSNYVDKESNAPYESLLAYLSEEMESLISVSYERYWHGFLLFLKPLLYFFTLDSITYINIFMHFLVCFLNVSELTKENKKLLIIYFVFYISISPSVIVYSFQYAPVYYVTQIAIYIYLRFRKYIQSAYFQFGYFTIIGITTSYFDFLTYPIVSLGIPLIFVLLIENINIIDTIKYSVAWGIGYLWMWACKWIIGGIVLKDNLIKQAFYHIRERSSANVGEQSINLWEVIRANLHIYNNKIYTLFFIVLLLCIFIIVLRQLCKRNLICWKQINSLFIIAIYPFLWYNITKNHSFIHSFMTFRDLSVFFSAIVALPVVILSQSDKT